MALLVQKHHPNPPDTPGKFLEGNILLHITKGSFISAIGITALLLVDLVDIYFISLLGEPQLAAAVGFAAALSFFTVSLALASMIAATTTLSQRIGASQLAEAKHFYQNISILVLFSSILISIVLWLLSEPLLTLMGADGAILGFAVQYFQIVILSFPVLALAVLSSSVVRAHGDFGRATIITLTGGIANAVLDPIFIFGLNLGLEGAALASALSRVVLFGVGFYYLIYSYNFFTGFTPSKAFIADIRTFRSVFIPSALTNLTTPVGNSFVLSQMALYGTSAVAATAVHGRLTPVLFSVVLALSGAIGPIIGQNFGAKKYERVKQAVKDAVLFSTIYVLLVSLIFWLLRDVVVSVFALGDEAATLVRFYTTFISGSFIFVSIVFIVNATLNNIGHPVYATYLNLLRNIFFLIPFVYLGGMFGGAEGILVGQAVGAFLASVVALIVIHSVFKKLESIN